MEGDNILGKSLVWMLIIFSWLLYSCATPTADKSMATWKHQPGTYTYISPEYNIKLTFPNGRWSVYTNPQEVPHGMRRFWISSKEGDPVDVLIAQSLDNIVLKLTIIYTPLTEPAPLDVMMDHMVRKLGAGKKGEHSAESRVLQRPDGKIGIITFRVKAETPTKWLYAFVEEKGRLLWFVFHTYDMNPINWDKSECWDIINSYEYFDKPGYGETVDTEPRSAEIYLDRGLKNAQIGRYDKAISDYSKAIEINPTHANAYYNRGRCYAFGKGMYDKAIPDFNKAIEINPKHAWSFNDRGYTYQLKGQYDKAISDCNKAIEIDPMFYIAYNNRSFSLLLKGQYDKAITGFNKAIEINSKFAGAYANRAVAYFYKREYDKAWDDVSKAQDLGSQIDSEFLKDLREVSGRER